MQVGELPVAGNGVPVLDSPEISLEELAQRLIANNSALLQRLKQDAHADALWQTCREDQAAGRMTSPRVLQYEDLASIHLSPRFGVAQGEHLAYSLLLCSCSHVEMPGLTADGREKIRPIDDMSASEINAATGVKEKLSYDTLDLLFEALQTLANACEVGANADR